MKKKKRFIVASLGLFLASALLFMQYNTTLNEAEEIARTNEERAEWHAKKAQMFEIMSIMLGAGGAVFVVVGLWKKREGWGF